MPELRQFDLNLLVAFDLLMQEQNVSRAAERLFVSQSAMSHILQRLRQQLDDPLLVKTPSGMKPTERALALVEPVKLVLKDIERLIRSPEEFDPKTSQRRFVIAATDYIEVLLATHLVERINAQAPGINLHFRRTGTGFPAAELENGEVDVLLGFEVMLKPPKSFLCETLFDDCMVCLARADHPALQAGLTLEEYLKLPHILISRTGTAGGQVDEWLAEQGLERRIALVVSHFLSAPLIVANTDMILALPKRTAEQFARMAPLKIMPLPFELPRYGSVMIWHPLHDKEPAHGWLRAQIRQVCQGLDAEA